MAFFPSPIAIPNDYADLIGEAYQQGALSPAEATAMFNDLYPKCAAHDTPCVILIQCEPACLCCVETFYTRISPERQQ